MTSIAPFSANQSSQSSSSSSSIFYDYLKPTSKSFDNIQNLCRGGECTFYGTNPTDLLKGSEGQRTEVLFRASMPIGLIIYGKDLQKTPQSNASFELKSLAIFDTKNLSDKEALINRAMEKALNRDAEEVHVTISFENYESLRFFRNRSFEILETSEGNKDKEKVMLYRNFQKSKAATEEKSGIEVSHNKIPKKRKEMDSTSAGQPIEKMATPSIRTDKYASREEENANLQERRTPSNSNSRSSEGENKREEETNRSDSSIKRSSHFASSMGTYSQSYRLHQVTLPKKYIRFIRSGEKPIEGRIYKGFVLGLKEQHDIRFFYTQNPQDDVKCSITKIERFASFPDMLKSCGYKNCVPDARTFEEAAMAYNKIPGYTENAKQHGVAAIHLKVIEPK
jgi:ASC-1-like (ASCH) protein